MFYNISNDVLLLTILANEYVENRQYLSIVCTFNTYSVCVITMSEDSNKSLQRCCQSAIMMPHKYYTEHTVVLAAAAVAQTQ
eukprot:20462-Heterococcus_DN1.PRE.1